MDRRDSIKSLLVGSIAGGLLLTGCEPNDQATTEENTDSPGDYGRTPKEKARDAQLLSETFFNDHELTTIAVLCDLILPASGNAGSATDAGVPAFIEFIVKDIRSHQVPLRGGLMWLDHRSNGLYGQDFKSCNVAQQKTLLDSIAWPDDATPEVAQGVKFFSLMRNLVLTGYYTSETGIRDLGYQGNTPNAWDGVPATVLAQHGLSYDPAWLDKCIDQDTRNDIAQWDEAGNLI